MQKTIKEKQYDWIVLGGGSGGLSVAEMANKYNKKVLIIDPGPLGGTCVNEGCVPKKMMWNLVECYQKAKLLTGYGFESVDFKFDYNKFKKKRDESILNINNWYKEQTKGNIKWEQGCGELISPNKVKVNGVIYHGDRVVISTGAKPTLPKDIVGHEHGITSRDFFKLDEIPQQVAVVGSGYIALELACLFNTLQKIIYNKSNVKVIVRSSQVLKMIDEEITSNLVNSMTSHGIKMLFKTNITKVVKQEANLLISLDNEETINSECLLWAIGREPNIDQNNLKKLSIELENNNIKINNKLETSLRSHYAIGDVTNHPQLTPVAIQCGRRLVKRIEENDKTQLVDFNNIPTAVFTHPQVAVIGLTEKQAKEIDPNTNTYTSCFSPMMTTFESELKHETLIKLVCTGEDSQVVGLHMIGECTDEILQGFATAISKGITKAELDRTVAIHPTSAEEVVTLKPML